MHRTKKITVVTAGLALLMAAAGMSSAMAAPAPKITICHRTGSDSNPYVKIRISENAKHAHIGADAHPPKGNPERHDFELSDPSASCTTTPGPGPGPGPNPGAGCNASSTSSNSTGNQTGVVNFGGPVVDLSGAAQNLLCQASLVNNPNIGVLSHIVGGEVFGPDGGGCNADSTSTNSSGDQRGILNFGGPVVDASGALANTGCQLSARNNLNLGVLSHIVGGEVFGPAGDGCNADSTSDNSTGDQYGLVNFGGPVVDLSGAAQNLLCQASLVNNPNIGILSDITGGSVFSSGLLSGSPLGILGGSPLGVLGGGLGYLPYAVQTDASVVANLLLQF